MQALRNPAKPRQRDRVLSLEEIKAVWHTDCTLTPIARICMLGVMRRTEAFLVQPDWIRGDYLTIPAEVAKNGRAHRLYVTPLFRAELEKAPFQRFAWADKKRELDSQRRINGPWVLHDLRRSSASLCAAPPLSMAPHLIERLLNHVTGSGTALQHIYQRYQLESEQKEALERFHAFLEGQLKSAAN